MISPIKYYQLCMVDVSSCFYLTENRITRVSGQDKEKRNLKNCKADFQRNGKTKDKCFVITVVAKEWNTVNNMKY